ncbi:MAG: Wzy polymerase domain-containing protein, partial [Candidatus Nitrotoga sp.]
MFRTSNYLYISLSLVGLMWVLPFLYYHHAYPLTTFYQEWSAAMLGLCAMPLLMTKDSAASAAIPRIALLPVALILLVLLQALLGKLAYFEQALLFNLYMLWAVLLLLLGHRLRTEIGLPILVTVLATFLLLGAELNAFMGILQHYRWDTWFNAVVTEKTSSAIYGNVAQPNHFAHYIALGLISLGLLLSRRILRAAPVLLLTLPLLFVLVLSGSRTAGLYLIAIAVLAYWWQRKNRTDKILLHYAMLLLLGFALMHWVVQLPWLTGTSGSVTTVQRLLGGVGSGGIRLYLWRESWHIFAEFPLLGAGFGQFAWQHFLLLPQLQSSQINGLYNNAHNIIMQFAAEMGAMGLLILFGTLFAWLGQIVRVQLTIYHWWGYTALSVIGIHSLLEYPLWYAYFLGVAAIILGMLDERVVQIKLHNGARIAVLATLLFGMVTLMQLFYGYRALEYAFALRPNPASAATTKFTNSVQEIRATLQAMPA